MSADVLVVFDFQYLDHVSFLFSPSLPVISKISVTSKVAADDATIARKLPPLWAAVHLRARSLRRLQQVARAEAHAVGDAHAVISIRTEEKCATWRLTISFGTPSIASPMFWNSCAFCSELMSRKRSPA